MIEVTPRFTNIVCRHDMMATSDTGSVEMVSATTASIASWNPGTVACSLINREHSCAGVHDASARAWSDATPSGQSA